MSSIDTLVVHAGVEPELVSGAIMTPIFQTSTYVQPAPGEPKLWDYARGGNPTRAALESSLAAIERAKHAVSFASGLAATQAIAQSLFRPGDRVLVSDDAYGGTGRLFRQFFAPYGIEFDFVDLRDLESLRSNLNSKTRLVWVETPTNPLLRLVDIAAIAELARSRGALTAVDNTFASPIFQNPLLLGADLVVHSTTKYIGGHSDLIGGAVMTSSDELAERIRFAQFAGGAVNSPQDAFLLLRSIKTLAVRMERHEKNAHRLAEALQGQPDLTELIYPGLPTHPQHALARKQMRGFSGVLSLRLKGGRARARAFLQALRVFALAESLGGVESLANHPETMTHASVPPELRARLGISSELVRLSVGIENTEDLIEDVKQALRASS